MPKVTVVTVPADTLPQSRSPQNHVPTRRRIVWSSLFDLLRKLTEQWLSREALAVNMLALLLGRVVIMGEIAPFGLAFFTAVARVSKERAGGAAFWSLVGVASTGRYVEAAVYIWTIFLFYKLTAKLNSLPQRIATVPLLVFTAVSSGGLLVLLWQQPNLYQIMLVLFEAAICTIASFVFMYGVPSLLGRSLSKTVTTEMLICTVLILSAAVAGFGNITLWDYSVRNMVGALLVMGLAFIGGPGIGAAVGVTTGLVIGLTEGNVPTAIAFYSLAGTLAGTFRNLGRYATILGYLLGAAIPVLGFLQGSDMLLILTETAVAAAVFLMVPAVWLDGWGKAVDGRTLVPAVSDSSQITVKLENISEIFADLAGAFQQISAGTREKIRETELSRLLSAVGDRVCGPCSRRTDCWEREFYRTYQSLLDILSLAETNGLTIQALPQPLRDNCLKRNDLIETVGLVAERNKNNLYWHKRIAESRQMITEQLKAAASIISELVSEVRKEPYVDGHICRLIKDKAALLECELAEVQLSGNSTNITSVEICKQPCSGTRECLNTVLPLAANLLKQKLILHADCGNSSKSQYCRLSLKVAGQYYIQTGMASTAKLDGAVNGDTCSVKKLEHGKILMMLSDGMGSGSRAATESKMAVSFLERLMEAGFGVDAAIKTVNSMLLLRMPEESFATVDMAVIDVFSGEAEFLKIGAAPSFIKRVREVTTIKTGNLPIGILNQIEIEPVTMALATGDVIVMVSDGVSEVGQKKLDRENWIVNFLRRQTDTQPQELADRLLEQALGMTGGKARDDMTILTAVLYDRPAVK